VSGPVRVGLLSTARINLSLMAAAEDGEVARVVAVASREGGRVRAYAGEHGIAAAHGSYEALLADPAVELVYVSVPNALHAEWVLRALDAGKHVLCEKPLSPRRADAARCVEAAARAGLVLAEGYMYRHHPQTRRLTELIRSGAIGRVREIDAAFGFAVETPDDDALLDPALDGGSLLDVGCYPVSAARLLCGEPVEFAGTARRGATGVDIGFRGELRFACGVVAHVESWFDRPHGGWLEVRGTEGVLRVADPWTCAQPGIGLSGSRVEVEPADSYRLQLADVAAGIRDGRPALVSGDEITGQAGALEALLAAAR
jgi:xylose dehydrogenase (NAD/NADP)